MHDIIKVEKVRPHAIIPRFQSDLAAGFDFHAARSISILPGETVLVPTGLKMELPYYTEMQIRPRSGLAKRWGHYMPNSPGTVDADYRGEIMIMVRNTQNHHIFITRGDRIAQGIIAPVIRCAMKEVEKVNETARGSGGFGSTGR
jgi:dUTP pyrophosphatase